MFNNEKLNKVYEERQSDIENHLKKLDKISRDIKTLNNILRASAISDGITLDVRYQEFDQDFLGNLLWDGKDVIWQQVNSPINNRKLIETPSKIRLIVSDFLPGFLAVCVLSLKKGELWNK